MTIFNPLKGGSDRDLLRVRSISSEINKRLTATGISSDGAGLEKLTTEQLKDLNFLVSMADLLLTKYADKKEAYTIFKEFASIIVKTADSLEQIDDEISELLLSANDSISNITAIRDRISDKANVDSKYTDGPDCTIND